MATCTPDRPQPAKITPEQETLSLAQSGNEDAFTTLYNKNRSRIFRYCLRMTGDVATAEDMTQSTFFNAFRGIRSFGGRAAFYSWLHSIARNECLMFLRKKRVLALPIDHLKQQRANGEAAIEIQPEQDEDGLFNDGRHSELGATDRVLESTPTRILIDEAIRELPPGYRRVIEEHHFDGLMLRECAARHGSSVGTAKSQHHKAMQRLAEIVAEKYGRRTELKSAHGHQRKMLTAQLAQAVLTR